MTALRPGLLPRSLALALTITALNGCGNPADPVSWRDHAKLPYAITEGLEIARNEAGKAPASLAIVCGTDGELRLLLLTKLPVPREFATVGRDDDATLFVSGIGQKIPIVADVVAIGDVDTVTTLPLQAPQLQLLTAWFGPSPPNKVDVVGIQETAVFMRGVASSAAVSTVVQTCGAARVAS